MRIAYLSNYVGPEYRALYCQGKKYALSSVFKSQGIARALLKAGHDVTLYSPGLTVSRRLIPAHTEIESFEEGRLTIKYHDILSYPKCSLLNELRLRALIRKDLKKQDFDVFLFYNISTGAALLMSLFKNSKKVLEYEDNIFNKNLVGGKSSNNSLKKYIYNYIVPKTDGMLAVCKGMLCNNDITNKILIPGIINDEVISNISDRRNKLRPREKVRIFLTGGTHYSKGFDLLIDSLHYVQTSCQLEVFGNGIVYGPAMEAILSLPDRHVVHMNGYKPHDQLIKEIDSCADILINVTRSMGVGAQAAGFPFKMMEYASTGRPIVCSEIGKLDDEFNSKVTYYDGESPENIALAIEDVIKNYDEKVTLALELQKRVLSEFSIEGTSEKLKEFLQSL